MSTSVLLLLFLATTVSLSLASLDSVFVRHKEAVRPIWHKLPKHGDTLQSVVISNGIGSVVSVAFVGSVASKIQAGRCSRALPKSSSFRVRRHPGRCPDPTPCQPRSSRVSDQQASLVGRVVDDLINQCRVRLHRKMSRFDSDLPAPLVQSLPTASQTSEAPVTSETPELSVSECVSRGDTSSCCPATMSEHWRWPFPSCNAFETNSPAKATQKIHR